MTLIDNIENLNYFKYKGEKRVGECENSNNYLFLKNFKSQINQILNTNYLLIKKAHTNFWFESDSLGTKYVAM